jgi:5-deoxy-glucuronate isomerase
MQVQFHYIMMVQVQIMLYYKLAVVVIYFGAQFLTPDGEDFGPVYHVRDGSTFIFDKGYHPCVVAPGFEMYYFTILAGETQRPLHMNYQKDYAYQLETIPGMQDMLNKFK